MPEKPTIRKSILLYSFIWHNIYGTGRILNLSTLPPNNSTARECPLSCKNGYIINTVNNPKTNKAKNFNASFILSPALMFAFCLQFIIIILKQYSNSVLFFLF